LQGFHEILLQHQFQREQQPHRKRSWEAEPHNAWEAATREWGAGHNRCSARAAFRRAQAEARQRAQTEEARRAAAQAAADGFRHQQHHAGSRGSASVSAAVEAAASHYRKRRKRSWLDDLFGD
jgi:hypothetical protein